MKDYLNQEEHRMAVYYMSCYGYMTMQLASHKKNMSLKEITCIKYIQTYLNKYFQEMEKRVGKKAIDRIMQDAIGSEIRVLPKGTKQEQFVVSKEALEGALTYAVESKCSGCTRKDFENCHLWKCMQECGMESVRDREHNGCEFSI